MFKNKYQVKIVVREILFSQKTISDSVSDVQMSETGLTSLALELSAVLLVDKARG